jgi:hypothetical protein
VLLEDKIVMSAISSRLISLPAKNLKRITTYVPPEVYAVLEKWAEADGRPLSNLVSRILAQASQEYRPSLENKEDQQK